MTAVPSTTHDSPRGFSLVELVLVVAIMGVMAAIAMPRFASASAARRLDSAAQRLTADLRHAQQHALASSAQVQVTFDADTETYTVGAPSPVSKATSYTVSLSQAPSNVFIESTTLGSSRAVFDGNGQAVNTGTITLRAGKLRQTVSVTATTPHITVTTAVLAP